MNDAAIGLSLTKNSLSDSRQQVMARIHELKKMPVGWASGHATDKVCIRGLRLKAGHEKCSPQGAKAVIISSCSETMTKGARHVGERGGGVVANVGRDCRR